MTMKYVENLASVKQNGFALASIPTKLKTAELCLAAVKQNGYALGYVPCDLKTIELCETAVKQNSEALTYVPARYVDEVKTLISAR